MKGGVPLEIVEPGVELLFGFVSGPLGVLVVFVHLLQLFLEELHALLVLRQ